MTTSTVLHNSRFDSGNKMPSKSGIVAAYCLAKTHVLDAGFGEEISWQASLEFDDISESDFLREHAWVTLSAGMHERVIRRLFQAVSQCFYDWESAKTVVEREDSCRRHALQCFNNHRKIEGIIDASRLVASIGFGSYKKAIGLDPLQALRSLPFVGPITCYHLAKNIGLPVAKPDRHLVRLANSVGYFDVQQFCKDISSCAGDSIPVVDIVLWRFAVLNHAYLSTFCEVAFKE